MTKGERQQLDEFSKTLLKSLKVRRRTDPISPPTKSGKGSKVTKLPGGKSLGKTNNVVIGGSRDKILGKLFEEEVKTQVRARNERNRKREAALNDGMPVRRDGKKKET